MDKLRYFKTYRELCEFCKTTGTDKEARRKVVSRYMGEAVTLWALPEYMIGKGV